MLALGIVIDLKLSLLTEEKMALLTIILLKVTVVLVLPRTKPKHDENLQGQVDWGSFH